jgi:hypothetical protein
MKILAVGPISYEFNQAIGALIKLGCPADSLWLAHNLDTANKLLPDADAVLSADTFPSHAGRASEPAETRQNNWAALALKCMRAKKRFVLLTGDERLMLRMNAVAKESELGTGPSRPFAAFHSSHAQEACQALLAGSGDRAIEPSGH